MAGETKTALSAAQVGLGHMTVDTYGKQFLPTFHMAFKATRNSG